MELLSKIQSTKLGIAGASLVILQLSDSGPWPIVVVAAIYMLSDAISKLKKT